MKTRTLSIVLLFALALVPRTGRAQDLVLQLMNGTVELYPTPDIRSIKFDGATMKIHLLNGTTVSHAFVDVRSYAFTDINTGLADRPARGALTIHPNPADGPVLVALPDGGAPFIVEVLDAQGRVVDRLPDQPDAGSTLVYDPHHLGAGLFLFRATGRDLVLTTSILVQ